MKPRELIRKLHKLGWETDRINGSHHILEKDGKSISIPVHNTDLKPGILNKILKQSGLK